MKYLILALLVLLGCRPMKNYDEEIVLVNCQQLNGGIDEVELANGISVLNTLSPKVLAIDLKLPNENIREYDHLTDVLNDCTGLVIGTKIADYTERLEEYTALKSEFPTEFILDHARHGFTSRIQEEDVFLTVKKFSLWEKVDGKLEYQLGVQVAMLYDSAKTFNFIREHPKINDVNFHGGKKFKTFEMNDVINRKIIREDIEGKIVLLGNLGPKFTDRFFSGIIKRGNGSFVPDMYAVEYHAHVITQILNE